MKISNSKKELARIISENGGWQEHCEWAVQDKSGEFGESSVILFDGKDKPIIEAGMSEWMCAQGYESDSTFGKHVCDADKLVKNWHQTILSRAEYFHLYPEPDADGWIEWKGGECPVDEGTLIDVRYRDGHEQVGCKCGVWGDELYATSYWLNSGGHSNIIAYRLHKPVAETVKVMVENKTTCHLTVADKPTIEQLAADYRNAKDYADRKQQEADDAKADAKEKLNSLVAAGNELGLDVSPTTDKQERLASILGKPEMVITDWRGLQVGDEVEIIESMSGNRAGEIGVVSRFDSSGKGRAVRVIFGGNNHDYEWLIKWRFIRRQ